MALRLELSDSEETWFYQDSDEDGVTGVLEIIYIQPEYRPERAAFEAAVSAFTENAIAQALSGNRVTPPAQYALVESGGVAARVIPLMRDMMHGMRLVDLTFSGMFTTEVSKRVFFQRLQQDVLRTILTGNERIRFIRVSDPLLELRPIFEGLYEWTLFDEDPAAGEGPNAPRNRYWQCDHPARSFFNTNNLPVLHMLSGIEQMLVASQNEQTVLYSPLGGPDVNVSTSAFVHLPRQNAQYQDDTDEDRPSYIHHHERFGAFFEHIVTHCRILGNAELATNQELVVVTIDSVIADIRLDSYRMRVLLAFLAKLGRIFMRPLIVHASVYVDIMAATENRPFELLPEPRPYFSHIHGEDYYYWLPDKRVPSESGTPHPAENNDEDDDDEKGRDQKRRRLTDGSYKCANCHAGRPRFLATLSPMCSFKCSNKYYMLSE